MRLTKGALKGKVLKDAFDELTRIYHAIIPLILGISDTTPPAADFERLKSIGQRVRAFGAGPVKKGNRRE